MTKEEVEEALDRLRLVIFHMKGDDEFTLTPKDVNALIVIEEFMTIVVDKTNKKEASD